MIKISSLSHRPSMSQPDWNSQPDSSKRCAILAVSQDILPISSLHTGLTWFNLVEKFPTTSLAGYGKIMEINN